MLISRLRGYLPTLVCQTESHFFEMHIVAANKGGKCLSPIYLGTRTKLDWECSEGHRFRLTLHRVRNQNGWCTVCNKRLIERGKDYRVFTHLSAFPNLAGSNRYRNIEALIKITFKK
jgi:hypothetical protein